MTDKEVVDKIYDRTYNHRICGKRFKERPDSLIAGKGGQTGLNMEVERTIKEFLINMGVRNSY